MNLHLNVITIFFCTMATFVVTYEFPPYEIEVYTPKGFKISIPHTEGVTLFAVHININKEMEYLEAGEIAVDVVKRRDGRWVYEDRGRRFKIGDKLYFWLYVIYDKLGYRLDDQQYTVQNLLQKIDSSTSTTVITNRPPVVTPPTTNQNCDKSPTTVSGKQVCERAVIFFERFNNRNGWGATNNWITEINVARTLESYFVVASDTNRYVVNSVLEIKPSLVEDKFDENFIRSGHLKLPGCTSEVREECEANGFSWNIIPPVLTSRINTKNSFNFKYGTVEIRAKLPKGDWIVPELWLVGKDYGPNSGRIIIAKSFGNEELLLNNINIGSKMLYSGVLTNQSNRIMYSLSEDRPWADTFRTYAIRWTPDYIKFLVDQVEVGMLAPNEKLNKDIGGSQLAPFDKEFYISLGIHVGGLVDFPNDSVNRGKQKPWKNDELKNTLKFWQDKNNWYPTWGEHSKLLIEYVKVTAL